MNEKETEKLEIYVNSPEETVALGEIIGKSLEPGTIIALKGGLGAGKTVLVKGLAKGLGVGEDPVSPTFVIMNAYEGRLPLYHFDLYRVSGAEELAGIGFEEFLFGRGVSAVEWADRIEEILPEYTIYIEIDMLAPDGDGPETGRGIRIEGKAQWVSLFRNTAERAFPAWRR